MLVDSGGNIVNLNIALLDFVFLCAFASDFLPNELSSISFFMLSVVCCSA